jgi:hypothetical protein
MSDDQPSSPPPTDNPHQSAPADPPPPPADFGTQDSMAENRPLSFGEQIISKGGLPPDLETRISKIEKGE